MLLEVQRVGPEKIRLYTISTNIKMYKIERDEPRSIYKAAEILIIKTCLHPPGNPLSINKGVSARS